MKKRSSKLESTRKTEQDRPCRKFWLLVKRSTQKVKVKVNCPGSKSTDTSPGRFRVSGSGHGSSSRSADVILWRVADVDYGWRGRACVAADVEWWRHHMTSDDISGSVGAWRSVQYSPTREGACNTHRRVKEQSETQVARGGACSVVWPPVFQAK